MMRVYRIGNDERASVLVPLDPGRSTEVIGTGGFTGSPMRSRWATLSYRFEDRDAPRSDFVLLMGGVLTFGRAILEEFSGLFESVGEILDLDVDGQPHFALNVLHKVDALNLTASGATLWPHGTIRKMDRHVFEAERVVSETIFQVPELRGISFLMSPTKRPGVDFYRRYVEAGYSGLTFTCVWEQALQ
jgi:hypothetical protein